MPKHGVNQQGRRRFYVTIYSTAIHGQRVLPLPHPRPCASTSKLPNRTIFAFSNYERLKKKVHEAGAAEPRRRGRALTDRWTRG